MPSCIVEFVKQRGVVARLDHDGDVVMVLGGGADHGRAADVDILDAVGKIAAARDGFLERIEIDDQNIDRHGCDARASPRCAPRCRGSPSSPPCTAGCSVLTRPSIISGNPVSSLTSRTFRPASLSVMRVPPVETSSMPKPASVRAKSTTPDLSETEMRARDGAAQMLGHRRSPRLRRAGCGGDSRMARLAETVHPMTSRSELSPRGGSGESLATCRHFGEHITTAARLFLRARRAGAAPAAPRHWRAASSTARARRCGHGRG